MTFKESVRSVYRTNYANFKGCASRSEYWWVSLFNFLVMVGIISIMHLLFYIFNENGLTASLIVYALLLLFALIPGLAVTVRRLHDTNTSGWWSLIFLVPWLGAIILLSFMLLPSSKKSRFHPKDFHLREMTSRTSTTFNSSKYKYIIPSISVCFLLTFSVSARIHTNESNSNAEIKHKIDELNKVLTEWDEVSARSNYINDSVKRLEKRLNPTTIQDINYIYGSTSSHLDFGTGENDRIAIRQEMRARAQGKWNQFGNMLAQSLLRENYLNVLDLFSFGNLKKRIRELRLSIREVIAPIHRNEQKPLNEWYWCMVNFPSNLATIPYPVSGYWQFQYISVSIEAIKSSM